MDGSGGGDTERERGRGTCDGDKGRSGTEDFDGRLIFTFDEGLEVETTLDEGFFFTGDTAGGGVVSTSSIGVS